MASTVSPVELDPVFVRALRLLHSKAKDSADQLRQMLEDVLQQKSSTFITSREKQQQVSSTGTKIIIKTEHGSKAQIPILKSSTKTLESTSAMAITSRKGSKDEDKKRDSEKRSFDKIKQDVKDAAPESKKLKIEKPSPVMSPPTVKLDLKEKDSESDTGNTDADDFAMKMGLACVVCRNIEVSSGNRLVECQECHNLYHQECHKPPVTDQDANDPRLAWYCAKCAKNIKKLAIKSQKPTKSGPPNPTKESTNTVKTDKSDTAASIASSRLFKRSEIKLPLNVSSSSNSSRNVSSSNKPTGLAGLAASLSGRSNLSKNSHSGNGSKTSVSPKPSSSTLGTTKPASSPAANNPLGKSGPFASLTSNIKSSSTTGSSSSSASRSSVRSSSPLPSKSTSSNSSSSSNSSNSSSSSSSSSSGNGSNGNGNGGSGNGGKTAVSRISADKRLQIMKKKAEKKMQEKRWK